MYNKTKKFNMEFPELVLASKLLEGSKLKMKEEQLVLMGVNYSTVKTFCRQMAYDITQKILWSTDTSSKEMVVELG